MPNNITIDLAASATAAIIATNLVSDAIVTNLNVRNNLSVTNAITAQSLVVSNVNASSLLRLDANKQLAAVTIGSNINWDGTTISATTGAGGDSVQINGLAVTDALFTNSTTIVWYTNGTASTEILGYVTNVGAAQLATDSVSADELNAAGVATELEAAMALQDISGAVTDSQVPNNITIDLAASATAATIATNLVSDAIVTNLNVRNNLTVTNALTAYSGSFTNSLQRNGVNVVDATETTAIGANARVAASKNSGATVGTRRRLNFIEGSNVTLTVADDNANEEVDITIAASGTGGGDNVQINGLAVTDALITNSTTIVWYTNGTASTEILGYVTNVAAAQLATDSVSADELNATGVESELEGVLDLPELQGVLLTAQLPTAYLGSWQITNALNVYDFTVTNSFTVLSNINANSLYVTNDAVFKNVLTTNLYLTNGVTSGALFASSGGLVTNTGTLDPATTGVTVKGKGYLQLIHAHHGSTSAVLNTNNNTADIFGHATFANGTDIANNFIEYHVMVPTDIDTSVNLRAKFKHKLLGADTTGTHLYTLTMASVADSASADAPTLGQGVNLKSTADAAGANLDVGTIGWVTLTNWNSNVTADQFWVIRLGRDGDSADDTSTVDTADLLLVIEYGWTQ